jgi:hypothetical protein
MSQCGFLLSCNLNNLQGSEERPVNSMPSRVSATAPGPLHFGDYAGPPIVQTDERQRQARALSVADRLEWATTTNWPSLLGPSVVLPHSSRSVDGRTLAGIACSN